MGTHMPLALRRKALLDGAWRVIHEQGVQAATTRAITAEADQALASFHYCFNSHDELIMELTRNTLRDLAGTPGPDLADAQTPAEMIRRCLRSLIAVMVADPKTYWAALEMTQYAQRKPALDGLAQQIYAEIIDLLVTWVASVDQFGVEWTRPVREIAWQVIATGDGIAQSYLATRDVSSAYAMADVMAVGIAGQVRPRSTVEIQRD